MSVYYDPKAARANARGEAELRKAEAEKLRAEGKATVLAAQGEQRRAEREQAHQQREAAAAARRARVREVRVWLAGHPIELLMGVIVLVPAVLAWSAMADYGAEIFGPALGWGLPLFSEGSMWAFAVAAHAARREGKPAGALQVGVWTFATVAGVLNFTHGLTLPGGGLGAAVVMALVSIGGVIVHQLITAGPTRTRRTRRERIAARRAARMERAALRQSVGRVDEHGRVVGLHAPATVTLRRSMTGRARLQRTTAPGLGDDAPDPSGIDRAAQLADEVEQYLRDAPQTPRETPPAVPVEETPDTASDQRRDTPPAPRKTGRVKATRHPRSRSMEQLRDELRQAHRDGRVDPASAESIRTTLHVSRDRAKTLRDEWNDGSTGTPTPA
ncbi:DUF2637 domain-containing protein [Saccharopolyspora sp. 6M]|uniref:DUF2637 domain-containing protein n=1 Tax=Saccharopolyspora sp. 6M TaxID=2877237 RepID=UPI001CD40D6D|nr:DUF2637 domain-containing protein [Saccharopolyspora sp. 6M]MCA1228654.1 DUF2637 domain-containing protein [Saccharopolyspora sp. 6M]